MESRTNGLSINEAQKIDMVAYLASLGIEPQKIRENIFIYQAPISGSTDRKMYVNRQLNLYYLANDPTPKTVVDFASRYHKLSKSEILDYLTGICALNRSLVIPHRALMDKPQQVSVLSCSVIRSHTICNYLATRRIDQEVAKNFCVETQFSIDHKLYTGLGFRNESDGIQIRVPWYKISTGQSDFTVIDNGAEEVLVFHSFIDFLSFLTMHSMSLSADFDFVILNDLTHFEKSRAFLENHQLIHLYLSRGLTGRNIALYATMLTPRYRDKSTLYSNDHDLNAWYTHLGR